MIFSIAALCNLVCIFLPLLSFSATIVLSFATHMSSRHNGQLFEFTLFVFVFFFLLDRDSFPSKGFVSHFGMESGARVKKSFFISSRNLSSLMDPLSLRVVSISRILSKEPGCLGSTSTTRLMGTYKSLYFLNYRIN